MAKTKDNVEMELAAVVKMVRTSIRTKHSIEADREINAVLPEVEKDFWAHVQRGKKYVPPVFELGR